MDIKIIAEEKLSLQHLKDVNTLYTLCNKYDSSKYVLEEENDSIQNNEINTFLLYKNSTLISSLNIFAPTTAEAEITALTSPKERNQGYFKELSKYLKEELSKRKIKDILYICDINSIEGINTIKHIGSKYEFSEFLMKYNKNKYNKNSNTKEIEIVKADIKDKDIYIKISSESFPKDIEENSEIITKEFFGNEKREFYGIKYKNNLVGMIGIYKEQTRDYIYGFCIDSKYRKRGIGYFSLNEIVNKCLKNSNREIVLEVQTENENALKMYKNIGFEVETEFQYYRDFI